MSVAFATITIFVAVTVFVRHRTDEISIRIAARSDLREKIKKALDKQEKKWYSN